MSRMVLGCRSQVWRTPSSNRWSVPVAGALKKTALLVLVWFLAMQHGGQAAPPAPSTDALRFFRNYFVTGDYAVGSVGMRAIDGSVLDEDQVAGVATRTLSMNLPDNGDDKVIVAAFLYWQTIVSGNQGSGTDGVLFRGQPITAGTPALTTAELLNPSGTTPCWSNGGAAGPADGTKTLLSFRTDVLRLLPRALIDVDDDNNPATPPVPQPIGERVVDDDALAANGYSLTTVTLPSSSSGNQVPLTNGASLVVVYRDEKAGAKFRAISIYDGGYSLDQQHETMTQTIQGFYQASTSSPEAKLTQIIGDGQTGFPERVEFYGSASSNTPDLAVGDGSGGPIGGADGNRWDAYTIPNATTTSLPVSGDAASVKVVVNHGNPQQFTPYDCLSWSAILFSTTVQDTDLDGLIDAWELNSSKGNSPLTDPNGVPLPPLADMGASKTVKDMFFQMDFMSSKVEHGGPGQYETPTEGTVLEHTHVPDYLALKKVGDSFASVPAALGGPINVHFDVGSTLYQNQTYIIPPQYTRFAVPETQECPRTGAQPACAFPGFYGVVGWKSAYLRYRDEVVNAPQPLPVNPATQQLYASSEEWCVAREPGGALFNPQDQTTWCRRRLERVKLPMFRYALWAHFVGRPQLDDPATVLPPNSSDPAWFYDESFYPRKNSGIADFPGADLMMALGGFVDIRSVNNVPTPTYNGSTVTQASTLMHEIGHTLYRSHGGYGGQGIPGVDVPLQNCRPNYLSVMNYLFQLGGLVKLDGAPSATDPFAPFAVDYERSSYGALNENELKEANGLTLASGTRLYRTRWNAYRYDTSASNVPSLHNGSVLDAQLGTTPLKRHCTGTPITADAEKDPGPLGFTSTLGYDAMVRVEGTATTTSIDWDADGQNDGTANIAQDLSFSGAKSTLEPSTPDWGKLQLQQLGSRRNAASGSIGAMSVGFFLNEQGLAGDEGVGDEGVGDEGVGDEGVGDEGVGDEGVGDEGVGDEGVGDEGVGDEGVGAEPSVDDGLHTPPPFATAQSLSKLIRITWGEAPVGFVTKYNVSALEVTRTGTPVTLTLRFVGSTIATAPAPAEPPTTIDDLLAENSKYYVYLVNAEVKPSVSAPPSTTVVTSYRTSNIVRK